MTPQELRNSILQLAIQGKLVEQRPEEGSAEELYQQIQEEKQRLIKEKKIKKDKPLPEITEDEKPFEIPESWKWVRFGEIFDHNTGKAMNASAKKTKKGGVVHKFITTSNLYWNSFDFTMVKEMFFSDDELERCTVTKGDLLICEGGAYYGRAAIWNFNYDICFQNHIHRARSYVHLELTFFYYIFYLYKFTNILQAKGTAMPGLSSKALHQVCVPLPPLVEQKRIVSKIEELLPLVDRYEADWSRLEAFNKRFPEDMQKSILQEAIQGKLVEQRPEEGTGEELYQQIQSEKQRLIKEKKIKKEKPLPEIAEDEKPFEIPESWKWVRIGDIFNTSSGTTPSKSNPGYYTNGVYNWVRTTDLNNSRLTSCEIQISQIAFDECRLQILPRKSVCIAMYGGAGTIGKNAILEFDTTINQSVCAIHPNNFCDMRYLQFFIQYFRPHWMDFAAGSRKDPNINKVIIRNAIIPLPPLAEQKRIVAKIEELLPLCERLKS